ncbi:MAG: PQQ-dependent sugar dehydrogenase [Vulcanimicrobiaceae bacterium]
MLDARPALLTLALLAACSGGSSSGSSGSTTPPTGSPTAGATPTASPSGRPTAPPANQAITAPAGFSVSVVANVGGARQLAFLPDGDLLVGTLGNAVVLVSAPDAGNAAAGSPVTFATMAEGPAQGVAYGGGYVYVATEHALWRAPYSAGMQSANPLQIASFRQGSIAPNSDGDVHHTSSVAVDGSQLFIGVGSSCNACTEVDPTRATIQAANLDGSGMHTYATRIRNPIALTVNPATGTLWAGGAGQDRLPTLHPYEYIDPVSLHAVGVDYGWPDCEENRVAYASGSDCSNTVIPSLELPAYATIIGLTFYPANQSGPYAFPASYRGGLFASVHGSWHTPNGHHVPPGVAFFPMNGDGPPSPVNWSDPSAQWSEFLSGFQDDANGDARIGRTTGIAVGPQGSLFVADDQSGNIYRIRPSASGSAQRTR